LATETRSLVSKEDRRPEKEANGEGNECHEGEKQDE
jgi:hypothetical protein